MASKQTLREVYLSKRLTLSDIEYHRRNVLITNKVLELIDALQPKSVHLFLSIISKKEFDTQPLIKELKSRNIKICIPKVIWPSDLEHFLLDDNCIIKENNWGIPEPICGTKLESDNIDLVLVPLIIADKSGHRIGYGKGYYDRFLSNSNSKKIGISLLPLLDEIPYIENNDVKLDGVITPFEITP